MSKHHHSCDAAGHRECERKPVSAAQARRAYTPLSETATESKPSDEHATVPLRGDQRTDASAKRMARPCPPHRAARLRHIPDPRPPGARLFWRAVRAAGGPRRRSWRHRAHPPGHHGARQRLPPPRAARQGGRDARRVLRRAPGAWAWGGLAARRVRGDGPDARPGGGAHCAAGRGADDHRRALVGRAGEPGWAPLPTCRAAGDAHAAAAPADLSGRRPRAYAEPGRAPRRHRGPAHQHSCQRRAGAGPGRAHAGGGGAQAGCGRGRGRATRRSS